ncbi:MAG: phosphoribosyltransferase [Acidilobaceae archaeon]
MSEVVYLSWNEVIGHCYRLALSIAKSGFKPDAIIAVLRGGLVPALVISDVLNVSEFYAVRAKHWGVAKEIYEKPLLEQLPPDVIKDRKVLVVDEVADTGKTLAEVVKALKSIGVLEARTAVIHLKSSSIYIPDYYVEKLDKWVWIFYPWSLIETLYAFAIRELSGETRDIKKLLDKVDEIARRLSVSYDRRVIEEALSFYVEDREQSR